MNEKQQKLWWAEKSWLEVVMCDTRSEWIPTEERKDPEITHKKIDKRPCAFIREVPVQAGLLDKILGRSPIQDFKRYELTIQVHLEHAEEDLRHRTWGLNRVANSGDGLSIVAAGFLRVANKVDEALVDDYQKKVLENAKNRFESLCGGNLINLDRLGRFFSAEGNVFSFTANKPEVIQFFDAAIKWQAEKGFNVSQREHE